MKAIFIGVRQVALLTTFSGLLLIGLTGCHVSPETDAKVSQAEPSLILNTMSTPSLPITPQINETNPANINPANANPAIVITASPTDHTRVTIDNTRVTDSDSLKIPAISSHSDKVPVQPIQQSPLLDDTSLDAQARQACTARNGKFQKVGRAQSYQCIVSYHDAGQICQDTADCEGECYANGYLPAGVANQTGQCARNSNIFGCRQRLKNGVASPTMCID